MMSVQVDRLRERWWVRGAVIAVALLALAAGLCLFDQDEGGSSAGGAHTDLCLVMLLVPPALMPLVGLLPAGPVADFLLPARSAVALHVPIPPPKLASLR